MSHQDETHQQNNTPLKKFVDEVTKNKIDRHLSDINDTISEEDIKNINTDISSPDVNSTEEKNNEEKIVLKNEEPEKEEKANNDDKEPIPTSWNILDQ